MYNYEFNLKFWLICLHRQKHFREVEVLSSRNALLNIKYSNNRRTSRPPLLSFMLHAMKHLNGLQQMETAFI